MNTLKKYNALATRKKEVVEVKFEGVVKSPAQKVFDTAKAVIVDYKKWEGRFTRFNLSIPEFLWWSALMLVTGAIFGMQV